MPTVTRTTGTSHMTVGVQHEVGCHCYLLTVQNAANSAQDLRAEDDAVNEVVEALIMDLNPLAYFVTDSNAGTVMLIMDKNFNDHTSLQVRIRRIGIDDGATTTSIGPNDIDISGSDVLPVRSLGALTTEGVMAFTGAS
tara:strand:+ start:7593 stop:8009 length:417 start_codon:yes stop_codon:yes gene_type:complete